MKSNIEQKIKESLQNHEMPYNASAWTAMQAKLDVAKPVSGTSPASNLKWYISAASVVVIGIVTYAVLNTTSESIKETPKQSNNSEVKELKTNSENISTSNNIENNTSNTSDKTIETNSVEDGNANESKSSSTNNTKTIQNSPFTMTSRNGNEIGNGNSSSNNNSTSTNNSSNTASNNNTSSPNPTTNSKNYILPNVKEVCEGETTTIKNTNDVDLLVVGPDMEYIIPANSERKVKMNKDGAHEISLKDGNSKKSISFFVKKAPKAEFMIDSDTKFEKGLPTTKLEATSMGVEYTWTIGKSKMTGEKVNAHFYNQGEHEVTLSVRDVNGCISSTSKSVLIDEKYNLLAVNSFIPEDTDPRNNTFMPFALTQRDVKFNLIVVDPTDGHTVFQSTDASNAWNGIDKTTGSPVKFGTTYVWKVVIENPEPNENNEYKGSITPIKRRQ